MNQSGFDEERVISAKCSRFQARENMSMISRAGKHDTDVKRGKTCQWCQTRENMLLMPSTGKHVTDVKRGKTCHWRQARENVPLMSSAGKHANNVKRGKNTSFVKNEKTCASLLETFWCIVDRVCRELEGEQMRSPNNVTRLPWNNVL